MRCTVPIGERHVSLFPRHAGHHLYRQRLAGVAGMLDGSEARVYVRGGGLGRIKPARFVLVLVAHHAQEIFERRQPRVVRLLQHLAGALVQTALLSPAGFRRARFTPSHFYPISVLEMPRHALFSAAWMVANCDVIGMIIVVLSPFRFRKETLYVPGSSVLASTVNLLFLSMFSVMPISRAAWRIRCSVSVMPAPVAR